MRSLRVLMAAMQLRGAPGDDVFRSASARAATCAADTPSSARFKQGDDFWVVKREPGSERADLPIFAARAGAVDLAIAPPRVAPTREDVAGAEGVFLVSDVLSGAECDAIVGLSEAMGYTEDAPVSLGRDVRRNENCVWIADERTLNGVVYARAAPLLPPFVELTSRGGDALRVGPLAGLNARWRLYKYAEADVFRAHTDGGWPGSGLRADGRLARDLHDGDRFSWLTFLLYLNDDFDGGDTVFYAPGGAPAARVRPKKGAALCFFHGHHPLSPLHEGALVTRGVKYVARTDVLYMNGDLS